MLSVFTCSSHSSTWQLIHLMNLIKYLNLSCFFNEKKCLFVLGFFKKNYHWNEFICYFKIHVHLTNEAKKVGGGGVYENNMQKLQMCSLTINYNLFPPRSNWARLTFPVILPVNATEIYFDSVIIIILRNTCTKYHS